MMIKLRMLPESSVSEAADFLELIGASPVVVELVFIFPVAVVWVENPVPVARVV
jgi:hypothetical protein